MFIIDTQLKPHFTPDKIILEPVTKVIALKFPDADVALRTPVSNEIPEFSDDIFIQSDFNGNTIFWESYGFPARIYRRNVTRGETFAFVGITIQQGGIPPVTSYTDASGLLVGETYEYYAIMFNGVLDSLPSNTVSSTVDLGANLITDLSAVQQVGGTLLTWTGLNSNKYKIFRRLGFLNFWDLAGIYTPPVSGASQSFLDTAILASGQTYTWFVVLETAFGPSLPSNEDSLVAT